MITLQDNNILVTGASRGIGKAIAVYCASQGARIAGLATSIANLDGTKEIIEAYKYFT